MKSYRLSREALRDLDSIFFYVARDRSVDVADKLVDSITARFPLLGQNPLLGRSRDEIKSNLRSFAVGEYLIYYRVLNRRVEISRVLHGARDQRSSFHDRKLPH